MLKGDQVVFTDEYRHERVGTIKKVWSFPDGDLLSIHAGMNGVFPLLYTRLPSEVRLLEIQVHSEEEKPC